MKRAICLCIPFAIVACACPPKKTELPKEELAQLSDDLGRVEECLERVEVSITRVESELAEAKTGNR